MTCAELIGRAQRVEAWVDLSARYLPDLIVDQHLIQAGYTVHFAVDFNELRSFLHPFELRAGPRPESWDVLLSRMLACAFLIYQEGHREHLGKAVLLGSYVDELIEHLDYIRRKTLAIVSERGRLEQLVNSLLAAPEVREFAQGKWTTDDDAFAENVVPVLRERFTDLARLWYTQEFNYEWNGTDEILKLDVVRYFDILEEARVAGPEFEKEVGDLAEVLYSHRRERLRRSSAPDVPTMRDARALVAIRALNDRALAEKRKDVYYLLTSTPVIDSLRHLRCTPSEEERGVRDLLERELAEPVFVGTMAERVERVWTVRHPFQIVLFLCHHPGGKPEEEELRKVLIRRLEAAQLRAVLGVEQVGDILRFFEHSCCGNRDVCERLQACESHEQLVSRVSSDMGSWTNLSSSLHRQDLLPKLFTPTMLTHVFRDFLQQLQEEKRGDYIDRLVTEGRKIVHDRLERTIMGVVVSAILARVRGTDLHAEFGRRMEPFPYRVRFGNGRTASMIEQCASRCRGRLQLSEDDCRESLEELVGVLRSDGDGEPSQDQRLLVAVLLMLLDDVERLRTFVESGSGSVQTEDVEWGYVRAWALYMSLQSRDAYSETDAEYVMKAVEKQTGAGGRSDPRVENLLGLTLLSRARRSADGELAARWAEGALDVFSRLSKSETSVLVEAGEDFPGVVENNLILALVEAGTRTNDLSLLRDAFERAMRLEKQGGLGADRMDTLAEAYLRFAMAVDPDRRESLKRGADLLQSVLVEDETSPVYRGAWERERARTLLASANLILQKV